MRKITDLHKAIDELDDIIDAKNKEIFDCWERIDELSDLVQSYKLRIIEFNKYYLKEKAQQYNVEVEDILNILGETYTIEDVDCACKKLIEERNSKTNTIIKRNSDIFLKLVCMCLPELFNSDVKITSENNVLDILHHLFTNNETDMIKFKEDEQYTIVTINGRDYPLPKDRAQIIKDWIDEK